MGFYNLYTYKNLEELRQIQKEREVIPFVFVETKDLLCESTDICIDITTLTYLLRNSIDNKYAAYINLREMSSDTIVIVEENLSNEAISHFPYLFNKIVPYYDNDNEKVEESALDSALDNVVLKRNSIYTYNQVDDLSTIINYANDNDIPITTFSKASGNLILELSKFNKHKKLHC